MLAPSFSSSSRLTSVDHCASVVWAAQHEVDLALVPRIQI